jgi:hydroxyacylglutathione hydrolase
MLNSLDRLAALPGATRVCCAHEYTLSNLKFALAVEPDNLALQAYWAQCTELRRQSLPTLPVALATERAINPFLRSRLSSVAAPVRQRDRLAVDDVTTFAALRQWKNDFR